MKNPVAALALALLVCLVALAAVLVRGAAPAPREVLTLRDSASISPDLLARLDELAEQQRALAVRVSMMEGAAVGATRSPVARQDVTRAELEAFQAEVLKALAGQPHGLAFTAARQGPEAFKAQVADTLKALRDDEVLAKVDATRQQRLDGLDNLMPKLEQQLGLTAPQSRELRAALAEKYDRDAQLAERWRLGEDPAILGQVKASDYATHQAALGSILAPEQLETYSRASGGRGTK